MSTYVGWLTGIVLVLSFAIGADAVCDPGELQEQKQNRASSLQLVAPRPLAELYSLSHLAKDSQFRNVWEILYSFGKITFEATTYGCNKQRQVDYPERHGRSWIYDVTELKTAAILDVRQVLSETADRQPDRYRVRHGYFIDAVMGRELRIASTIDFVVANPEFFFFRLEGQIPRAMVSGPYWKASEYGEKVIGLLKTPEDGNDLGQSYHVDFRGRHILCATEEGIDLISPESKEDDGRGELKEKMERQAGKCTSAIQIGPAYFERNGEMNKTGIAGLSLSEARRNIVIRAIAPDKSEKTFLWTGEQPISPFDAMVLIEAICDRLVGKQSIQWAVGLSDDHFLSGPVILLDNGSFYPLAPTDPPVGALLVFYERATR